MCGVFLDIKEVFDSVSYHLLLEKLSALQLPHYLISWFYSYLTERHQQVRVKSPLSPPLSVTSGVPQRSILGPLLFLIFINDLSNLSFPSPSKLFLFADSILLLHPLSSRDDLTSLQADLDSINNWLKLHLLTLNTSKSKYLIFSLKSQSSFDHLPPTFNLWIHS